MSKISQAVPSTSVACTRKWSRSSRQYYMAMASNMLKNGLKHIFLPNSWTTKKISRTRETLTCWTDKLRSKKTIFCGRVVKVPWNCHGSGVEVLGKYYWCAIEVPLKCKQPTSIINSHIPSPANCLTIFSRLVKHHMFLYYLKKQTPPCFGKLCHHGRTSRLYYWPGLESQVSEKWWGVVTLLIFLLLNPHLVLALQFKLQPFDKARLFGQVSGVTCQVSHVTSPLMPACNIAVPSSLNWL